MPTPFALLGERARRSPAAPVVTWYGAGGQRAELSAVTFATAVAKTAGLLLDGDLADLDAGARVRLELPLHWQLPVWLAGIDAAGMTAVFAADDEDLLVVATPAGAPATSASVVAVSADTAFGIPAAPVPPPFVDHRLAAMGQPDVLTWPAGSGAWRWQDRTLDGAALLELAAQRAEAWGVAPGGRLLVPAATRGLDTLLAVWPVPLLARASVVLVQDGDETAIADREQVTAVAPAEP